MNRIEKIISDGKELLQGYDAEKLDVFAKGALYGAKNHKDINRRSAEWYEEHNERLEEGKKKSAALCEFFKEVTGLGAAVEQLKNLKPYEEVRDDILRKLLKGFRMYPEERHKFMDILRTMDEQDEQLRAQDL